MSPQDGDFSPGHRSLPGAVMIGGDYQGLGIVRSLGRRGIDVVIVDDESSISRHSRYATGWMKVSDLRTDEQTVEALLDLARVRDVKGWVVFPTREETVAALSRNRDQLLEHFRIPTPAWSVTKWAWDKRNTYRAGGRARDSGSARMASSDRGGPGGDRRSAAVRDQAGDQGAFLLRHQVQGLACRTRDELAASLPRSGVAGRRSRGHGPGADSRQRRDPAALLRVLQGGRGACEHGGAAPAPAPGRVRARQHIRPDGRVPEIEELSERFLRSIDYYGLVELEYKYDPRDGLRQAPGRQRAHLGLSQPRAACRGRLPIPAVCRSGGASRRRSASARGRHVVGPPGDRPADSGRRAARRRLDWRAYMRSLRVFDVESVFSRDDPRPGLAELALLPYLAVKRGI